MISLYSKTWPLLTDLMAFSHSVSIGSRLAPALQGSGKNERNVMDALHSAEHALNVRMEPAGYLLK